MKAYIVQCSTGCSCCSYENHACGPYSSREEAEKACDDFRRNKRLSSQYAPQGRYDIEEYEAEQLPDGRLIIGNIVFRGFTEWGQRIDFGLDDCYRVE